MRVNVIKFVNLIATGKKYLIPLLISFTHSYGGYSFWRNRFR
jgi:hypothetical protein